MTVAEILLLPIQTDPRLIRASDTEDYYAIEVGQSGASATMLQKKLTPIVATPASEYAIPLPADGTYIGQKALYHITPTVAINLTNANALLVASDSLVAFPKALTQDKLYIVQLMWNGTAWCLVTLIGGY